LPIRPYLAGEAFEPEILTVMSDAFTVACNHLGLHMDADDAVTRLVAAKVIELARRGVHETEKLIAMTIEEFTS
jgi:hypothetical protein